MSDTSEGVKKLFYSSAFSPFNIKICVQIFNGPILPHGLNNWPTQRGREKTSKEKSKFYHGRRGECHGHTGGRCGRVHGRQGRGRAVVHPWLSFARGRRAWSRASMLWRVGLLCFVLIVD